MILQTLRLKNYKQYADLNLTFREGLVGIIGRNGAGKSTLFEAILFCLFGRESGDKNYVRAAFADAKDTVSLSLSFTVAEVLYEVRREFRGKALAAGAEFYKNETLVAKGSTAVNDEIGRVIHMEYDAFKRSVFSGQRELSELSDATGETRKRMVRRMLGLDTLDEVQTEVNSDIKEYNARITGQRQNLLDTETRDAIMLEINELAQYLDEAKAAVKTADEVLKLSQVRYKEAKQKFETEDEKKGRHERLQRQIAEAQGRLDSLENQRLTLNEKQAALQRQKEELELKSREFLGYEKDKKQWSELDLIRQRKLNLDTNNAQIQALQGPLQQAEAMLAQLANELVLTQKVAADLSEKNTKWEALKKDIEVKRLEYQQITNSISALNARVNERREKVQNLQNIGREGTCPTCFQPLMDAYDRVVAELNQQMAEMQTRELQALETQKIQCAEEGKALKATEAAIEQQVNALRAEQSRLLERARQKQKTEQELHRIQGDITKYQLILREIGEVHFDEKTYHELKKRLDQLEAHYLNYQKELNYVGLEGPATIKALAQNQEQALHTREAMASYTANLAAIGFEEALHRAAREALNDFEEKISQQTETKHAAEKRVLELENEWEQRQEKIRTDDRIKAQISEKLAEIELLDKLSKLLGQFKTGILEQVSPGISQEASNLFSRITKGKYESIRVDDNFDFFIADGAIFYPIKRFSGGEIDLANFCLRIAVTKAIMDLSGSSRSIEFLAFDEIFGSQDEERRMEMMLALNYLQEQFRQIYIVSHIEALKDFFPHLLEVQYAPEGSSVVWR